MKKSLSLLFFHLLFFLCKAQDTTNTYKIKYYTQRIQKYLDMEKKLGSHYSINTKGVFIYASASMKAKDSAEYKIKWDEVDEFKSLVKQGKDASFFKYNNPIPEQKTASNIQNNTKSLKGLKIAIDPGHFAGDFETGKVEMKYLSFKKDPANQLPDSIRIAEGMLTYATAYLLKEKLEAEGAIVFLTRQKNGFTAFGKTFDQWIKEDLTKTADSLHRIGKLSDSMWKTIKDPKTSKRNKFLFFKDIELAKRAEIINKFNPDLTIIIHYNVDETNTNWEKPGQKNFNMTFVGGAFMGGDLSSPEKRFEFLRLLLSDNLDASITLSSSMIESFEKNLNVKTAQTQDAKYLHESCLYTGVKGVYCRNLQLTRYIHSPLVYGETLYQDNITECKLLNEENDKTKNKRVQQVAEAYYQGVKNYVLNLQSR